MAQDVAVNLEASREKVRQAFATVKSAENRLRNAYISALSECYIFAQDCFQNSKAFEKLCDQSGIKKGHKKASKFLRVVKLVYSGEDAASRQLQSKYASVLNYADFDGVNVKTISDWLKKASMESRLNDARGDVTYLEYLGRVEDAQEIRERIKTAIETARIKNSDVLGPATITVDMDAEGAPLPGYHHLAVKVAGDGSVEIVGFTNDSEKVVERSIGRSYNPKTEHKKPWLDMHPLGGLLKAIKILSGSVRSSVKIRKTKKVAKATPAYFTFRNGAKNCSVLVSQLGVGAAPIAKASIPPIESLPIGTFILSPENATKLFNAARGNPVMELKIDEDNSRVDCDRITIRGKEEQRHLWLYSHKVTIGDITIPLFVRDVSTEGSRLDFVPNENANNVSLTKEDIDKWLGIEKSAPDFYSVKVKNDKISFAGGGTLLKIGDAKRAFGKLKQVDAETTATISPNYVQISSGDYEVILPAVLKQDTADGLKKGGYSHNGFVKARW